MNSRWQPSLGAWPDPAGTGAVRFRVWAPAAHQVELVREVSKDPVALSPDGQGYWEAAVPDLAAGTLYRYRVDGAGPWPDPTSRSQPLGVHGPSAVVDPGRFAWSDHGWAGPDRDRLVIHELHVGTFTPEGTFRAAADRFEGLRDLGVTAVQLLPVNDFPGRWGWGYDGVALFAPARCYGTPDDLRHLVDRAHALGLAVILDVVHNHFGPDGNYLAQFSPFYTTAARITPWGPAVNLLDEGSDGVRRFFVESCLQWLHEYHVDGFRFDATHALIDGDRPLCGEIVATAHASLPERRLVFVAEDHRNLRAIVDPPEAGGWGLDGVWADDLHHQVRRYLTGDDDGVFGDFTGSMADIARTIREGWLAQGEWSPYRQKHRGTDPTGLAPQRFIFCTQNHDRVGNRGRGERLNHDVDPATFRAVTALLLLCPQTPMLFMGQEWAASTPFRYFTDHHDELGRLVREGRRREFAKYRDFADPARLALVADPQAETTFRDSVLDWSERDREPHAGVWRLHQALLHLRADPAFRSGRHDAQPVGEDGILIRLGIGTPVELCAIVMFAASPLGGTSLPDLGRATQVLSTEEPRFVEDAQPIRTDLGAEGSQLQFARPGAMVLRKP